MSMRFLKEGLVFNGEHYSTSSDFFNLILILLFLIVSFPFLLIMVVINDLYRLVKWGVNKCLIKSS